MIGISSLNLSRLRFRAFHLWNIQRRHDGVIKYFGGFYIVDGYGYVIEYDDKPAKVISCAQWRAVVSFGVGRLFACTGAIGSQIQTSGDGRTDADGKYNGSDADRAAQHPTAGDCADFDRSPHPGNGKPGEALQSGHQPIARPGA